MKHKTLSRVITAVLCVVMLVSLFPTAALAIDGWETSNVTYSGTTFGTNGY